MLVRVTVESYGFSALLLAGAGTEWLHQGLSMGMAGPAGRAALGAPMFPLALEGEPHETPPSGATDSLSPDHGS
jgi:hypothetical protein